MTSPRRLLAALVVCSCMPAVAIAQPEPNTTAPEGKYHVGSALTVTPALVVVAGSDTNAIRANNGTQASEVYVVPQIEGWLGKGRIRLNFANAIEVSRQQTESTGLKGQLNQYHVVRASTMGAKASLEANASFRDHYAPPTDFAGFAFGIRSRRIERQVGSDLVLQPGGRLSFRARASLAQLRYDADARFRGVSLEKNLNRNFAIIGGEAQLRLTPMTQAGVSVTSFRDRFIFAPERDGDGMITMGGFQFSPAALLVGRVEAGYFRYTVRQTGKSYGSPSYNVGLSYQRSPFWIDVTGRKYIEYNFDPAQGFFLSNGIDVFSILALSTRWELFGRAGVRGLTPKGAVAENNPFRTIQSHKAGLARKFSLVSKIGVDIERYVTGGPGGFEGFRTTVFLTYGSTRLQRLDRPLPGGF